jgi:hypothetical protein
MRPTNAAKTGKKETAINKISPNKIKLLSGTATKFVIKNKFGA